MNYYYFFVLVHYHLGVRLSNCLESRGLLFDFHGNNITNQSSINQYCQRLITHTQILSLLSRNPCSSLENSNEIDNNNNRTRRNINDGNIGIKTLQTTINDHRVMIEYLFNNSINETILAKATYNHSNLGPSLKSWRDLVDIFCIGLVSILLIYLLICRAGFSASDKLLEFLFQPVLNRLQQKKQQQQQQQHTSTFPTAPPNTISDHIRSLSIIADGIQPNSHRIKT